MCQALFYALKKIFNWVISTTLWCRCYYHSCFLDEGIEERKEMERSHSSNWKSQERSQSFVFNHHPGFFLVKHQFWVTGGGVVTLGRCNSFRTGLADLSQCCSLIVAPSSKSKESETRGAVLLFSPPSWAWLCSLLLWLGVQPFGYQGTYLY